MVEEEGTTQISLKIDPRLLSAVDEMAKQGGQSRASAMRKAIQDWLVAERVRLEALTGALASTSERR